METKTFIHGIYPRSRELIAATRNFKHSRISEQELRDQQATDQNALVALQSDLSYTEDGKTYLESSLTQKRTLLSSIFQSKLSWSYPGFSNCAISPIYQAIHTFPNSSAPLGDPSGLNAVQILASWERLMQVYLEIE